MRILFLTYEYPGTMRAPAVSGEVKNPFLLASALSGRGHIITVINVPFLSRAPRKVETKTAGSIQVTTVPEGRTFGVARCVLRALNVAIYLSRVNGANYDVIHAEAPGLALGVQLARLANRSLRSAPLITSGHGTNLPEADADAKVNFRQRLRVINARLVLPLDQVAFRYSDAVISVSEFQKSELVHLYHVDVDSVKVIHNGVDLSRYKPSERQAVRTDKPAHLLFVGRLVPKKGLQHLLRALVLIREELPGTRLTIVGGSALFDFYGDVLRKLCNDLGLDDCVEWVMGVPEVDMPKFYQSADIAVFPSEGYESLPTVILEAMACGIPVVATRAWGSPEAMGADHPGFIAEKDPSAIANKVLQLISDDSERVDLVEQQIRSVARFSLAETVRKHEETYEEFR